ncbi:MAG TPA: hypothetical protein VIF88_03750 [Methylocystis sp.]|jgi:hypothetical protein
MRIVRFIKNDLPYLKDEIAGFQDHVAEKLIAKGFVVLHGDGKPKQVGSRIPDPLEFGYEQHPPRKIGPN